MSTRPRKHAYALSALALLVAAAPALAQSGAAPRADRLFLSFAEEASVVDDQWWEGRFVYSEGDPADVTGLFGIVAFGPWEGVELGGRVGFASSDTPAGLPDGSGATDLDVWGKLRLGDASAKTRFVVGGLATVPTGDDTAGLGFDAFGAEAFGSVRHETERAIVTGHLGLRINGDGQYLGVPDLDGEVAPVAAFGVIFPLSDELSVLGEARFEGERFDGGESDARLLGGVNWRVTNRGIVRAAAVFGVADGAPDAELYLGYAVDF